MLDPAYKYPGIPKKKMNADKTGAGASAEPDQRRETMSVNRRSFLAGAAVSGIAGLAPAAFASASGEAKMPSKWDITTDVAVAGSGIAGMCAAAAAVDGGAKVIVFEKGENYGGAAVINGGIMALQGGTKWQREHGVEDSPQRLYEHLTDPLNPEYKKNVPSLVKKYSEYCGPTQEWLEARGVKFLPTATQPGKYDSQHHEFYLHVYTDDPGDGNRKPQPSGGFMGGRGVMMPLKAYCEGKGVEIRLGHKVTDVYKNADGRVIGARVEANGKVLNVRVRKGVVLAGGNFKSNVPMRRVIDPRFATPAIPATGYPHYEDDGSAIMAGIRAGGMYEGGHGEDTPYMRRRFGTTTYGFPKGSKFGHPGIAVAGPRWGDVIFTNRDGKRFVREEDKKNLGGFTFYDVALKQPGLVLWTIFDDAAAKKNHWSIDEAVCEKGLAFKADTIEELAKATHQPELPAQVERYNGFVAAGKDDEFAKPAELMKAKIEKAPFYAVRLVIFLHNCPGGLMINDNAQVLDLNGKPIEGLYAAGESCGGLYVGNGMPRGIIPGRWAGEHASKAKSA